MTTAEDSEPLVHAEATFRFTVAAPMDVVTPLFGAERERVWAPDWSPRFAHPSLAADREGMVFTVERDGAVSVWVCSRFDLVNGIVQYVYVLPGVMATRITVNVAPAAGGTSVEVAYDRTALRADMNDHVRRLSEDDAASGPEWQGQIDEYLRRSGAASPE